MLLVTARRAARLPLGDIISHVRRPLMTSDMLVTSRRHSCWMTTSSAPPTHTHFWTHTPPPASYIPS